MKQNLIFVVILLVTLSMVNAIPLDKRATTFGPCPEGSLPILAVTLQPDPPVPGQNCTVTATGTIDSGINPGATLVAVALDGAHNVISSLASVNICSSGVTCPTTSLSVTTTFPVDASLPATYSISIVVIDENKAFVGCSYGAITG
ncbi:unnamed protein product [Rhizophagus irregularis]|uniref:Phosphatidylglycerol/phosphatidylinositol transfer protein n=1 Tax=Rhizophagus irregularis TaxID=588596 RepID=A0A2N1MS16_9GLOM|nr:hypothetical protein RhiirC2_810991 [Rhizophagus irregularis]CAB4376394.1 unnamed protein product [Rhizophagus irregularis]